MQPTSSQDYKQLLTDVIKKQIVILGPDITLSKARNVKGITVADDGTVTNVEGSPQAVTQALIDQFVQLSGLIVKKTMEPLLNMSEPAPAQPAQPAAPVQPAAPQAQVVPTSVQPAAPVTPAPAPQQDQIDHTVQAVIDQAVAGNPAAQTQTPPQQPNPVPQAPAQTNSQPAKNPLAA